MQREGGPSGSALPSNVRRGTAFEFARIFPKTENALYKPARILQRSRPDLWACEIHENRNSQVETRRDPADELKRLSVFILRAVRHIDPYGIYTGCKDRLYCRFTIGCGAESCQYLRSSHFGISG